MDSSEISAPEIVKRKMPAGAEIFPEGVHFRVWAPKHKTMEVVIEGGADTGKKLKPTRLAREQEGYFSGFVKEAKAGSLYRFGIDNALHLYPDPASRFQPEGPHGSSMVIDPETFEWTDQSWTGIDRKDCVIYEMHIGTFTHEGKWLSAGEELEELVSLGINMIEVMPVGDFAGRFGWGYDGVNLFAPTRHYGTPDDFRLFVNKAHSLGVGVILDVVYNHLGPEGNYLPEFSDHYFTSRYTTDWGAPFNFDGEHSGPVREFILSNVEYWIREFHLDGFRVDATQNIYDSSGDHILGAISRVARETAGKRKIYIVAENEPQLVDTVLPLEKGGYGYDALWNDDFHHSAMVALTARNEAYYTDYLGKSQEFISAAKWGYLYQGQRYKWQGKRRGTPTFGLEPENFVNFIQNHDQLANSAGGLRAHQLSSPAQYKAMTALMILMPGTPMLFQGQEFASSNPFFFFSDHREDIARGILKGRGKFLAQFRSLAVPEMQAVLPDPADPETFVQSKLNLTEREINKHYYIMHRDLLKLRKTDPAFDSRRRTGFDGAVLGEDAFVLRYFLADGRDRILVVNLGLDLHLNPAPEPLLAPPLNMLWEMLWSSEEPRYGGRGTAQLDTEDNWMIPGRTAVVLHPV